MTHKIRVGEKFVAETRKGAKLEFTRREAFLTYLFNAREMLLAGGSAGKSYYYSKPLSE
jgi:hypothetical protein